MKFQEVIETLHSDTTVNVAVVGSRPYIKYFLAPDNVLRAELSGQAVTILQMAEEWEVVEDSESWLKQRLRQIPANDECGFWNGAREAIQEAMTKILDEFPFEGNGTKVGKMEFSSMVDARTSRIIDILREVIGE